ncbi:hypothetical protein GQ44DRAFT_723979 [Phaeosphaeriaceae sp. PMI808]|nr:hypothetical protein GQ44DRAFT_723979 [Phaeosphaeriaceae sp. PMI808]
MNEIVPEGPWTKPLNFNQLATTDGEICVPFAESIREDTTSRGGVTFPQFALLPSELKIYFLNFCSQATLFRLMHVSSSMRVEAEKLFWSDPDTWYSIKGEWIAIGAPRGHSEFDFDFFANLKQIEISFDYMSISAVVPTDLESAEGQLSVPPGVENDITRFWKSFQRVFPHVEHVVFSERHLPFDNGARQRLLIQFCPPGLTVSASCLQNIEVIHRPLKRQLWKQTRTDQGTAGEWKMITAAWSREMIIPPSKIFRGLVGAYHRTQRRRHRHECHLTGLRLLRIEAIERFYFEGRKQPFSCPEPPCQARFYQPRQWLFHSVHINLDSNAILPSADLRAKFIEQEAKLEQIYIRDVKEPLEKMRAQWKKGRNQRRHIRHNFLSQLAQDPLYTQAKPGVESFAWRNYQSTMSSTSEFWMSL